MKYILTTLFIFALHFPAHAQNFSMMLPVDCELNQDCWFMNYVDHDTVEEQVKDAACESRSFDGHKGTDIAIKDFTEMRRGVDVVSAAPGKVLRLRDGESDSFKTREEFREISEKNHDCGNGIIIDHGDGWITQYCHLKKGSIVVEQGQTVRRGEKLAEIGLSGVTEHPHLHVSLIHKGKIVDPFTGREVTTKCGLENAEPLWGSSQITYKNFSLYDAGFNAERPDFDAISRGNRGASPRLNSDAMIFWAGYFGAKEGDEVHLEIRDPAGNMFVEQKIDQPKTRARQYYFIGLKKPEEGFRKGTWRGSAKVTRGSTGETESLTRVVDIF